MKCVLKGMAAGLLAVAVIIAVQMGLTGLAGFHTAELLGKTAVTALFLYAIIRLVQAARSARD